ncbi:MAG TPA: ferric iron uptake transcriptional regulator [Leucothrix sp.]|nr:ferric iron uptake transcriptional regulator [Leucothrix sp.]
MNMDLLKEAGLKTTQPRLLIIGLLEESKQRHLSTNDIYTALSDNKTPLTLGTIYRVLDQLEKAGLVLSHHFSPDNAVFELDDSEHHDHMVDIKTGKVLEFYDDIIEQRQQEIAKEHGLELLEHRLVLYGEFK